MSGLLRRNEVFGQAALVGASYRVSTEGSICQLVPAGEEDHKNKLSRSYPKVVGRCQNPAPGSSRRHLSRSGPNSRWSMNSSTASRICRRRSGCARGARHLADRKGRARKDVERSRSEIGATQIVPDLSHRENELVRLVCLRRLVLEHKQLAGPWERARKIVVGDLTLGRCPEKSIRYAFGHIRGHPRINGPLGESNRHSRSLTHSGPNGLGSKLAICPRVDRRRSARLRRLRLRWPSP